MNKYSLMSETPPKYDGMPYQTIYPVGNIVTTLCTPELKMALIHGHVVKVLSCVLYHRHKIWDAWVNYWWERKHQAEVAGNATREYVCKILLDSLVGKLAQKQRYWSNTSDYPAEQPWHSWATVNADNRTAIPLRSIGWQVQRQDIGGWCNHALVAASSHVSSYARVEMLKRRTRLPNRSVLYIANDALLVTQEGHESLCLYHSTDHSIIGSFRLKGTYEYAQFHGPRDYDVDGESRKAGLPTDRTLTGRRRWKYRSIESHISMINREPDGSVHVHHGEMSGTEHHWGQYDPGDGWLRPIRVAMWG